MYVAFPESIARNFLIVIELVDLRKATFQFQKRYPFSLKKSQAYKQQYRKLNPFK